MRLIVGYLATPSGEDGLALGIRLARTLGAEIALCIVLPPDRVVGGHPGGGNFEEVLAEQAQKWLDDAVATVPGDITVSTHIAFNDSFAEGLIEESARLQADANVLGAAGDGLIGRY